MPLSPTSVAVTSTLADELPEVMVALLMVGLLLSIFAVASAEEERLPAASATATRIVVLPSAVMANPSGRSVHAEAPIW